MNSLLQTLYCTNKLRKVRDVGVNVYLCVGLCYVVWCVHVQPGFNTVVYWEI